MRILPRAFVPVTAARAWWKRHIDRVRPRSLRKHKHSPLHAIGFQRLVRLPQREAETGGRGHKLVRTRIGNLRTRRAERKVSRLTIRRPRFPVNTKESFVSDKPNFQFAGAGRGEALRAAANKSALCAFTGDVCGFTGSVSETCAFPGMHISRQTSTLTSAAI